VQRRRGVLRRVLAPELVDELIRADDLVRVEQQECENGAPLRPADLDSARLRSRPRASRAAETPSRSDRSTGVLTVIDAESLGQRVVRSLLETCVTLARAHETTTLTIAG